MGYNLKFLSIIAVVGGITAVCIFLSIREMRKKAETPDNNYSLTLKVSHGIPVNDLKAYQYGDPDSDKWRIPKVGTLTFSFHVNPGFRKPDPNLFYCNGTLTVNTE